MIKKLLPCVFFLALSACGFSLRLPPEIDGSHQPMALITEEKFGTIYQAMKDSLIRNDVETTGNLKLARSRLEIFSEIEPERETLISAASGDEQLFVLQWRFHFFERAQGSKNSWVKVLDNQFISASKIVNKTQLEQQIGETFDSVRSQLRSQLADKILQQLNSLRFQMPTLEIPL